MPSAKPGERPQELEPELWLQMNLGAPHPEELAAGRDPSQPAAAQSPQGKSAAFKEFRVTPWSQLRLECGVQHPKTAGAFVAVLTPVPESMTLFGNWVFTEVIELK